ncbi:hypothetical protein ACH518_05470 [Methylomonas sp. HW2-6]|uniref:hypothetical protein n=1 Tax=Methylomonas sp. HW2-6 TaxID=3376687 RepID=UPI004042D1FD
MSIHLARFSALRFGWGMLLVTALLSPAEAATVSGGWLVVNLDRDALAAAVDIDETPARSMYLEEFFDAQASRSRSYSQILEDHLVPGVAEIPATGLTFAVNGSSVTNLTNRRSKPTTIDFDPADFEATVTGAIGLAGVFRFRVDTGSDFNRILSGDYTLEYAAANIDLASGRSAWSLYNHVSFRSQSYNLFNVVMGLDSGRFSLSGDLGLGEGYDHLNGTRDAIVGNFKLQTAVVPLPPAFALFAAGLAGFGFCRKPRGHML